MTRALAVIASCALLAGCRGLPFPEAKLEGDYGVALKAETRTAALYDRLETRAFVHLVRLSPGLLDLQSAEVSSMRAESLPLAAARREALRKQYPPRSFFAVVHTPIAAWNDWDLPASVWSVVLTADGVQTPPEKVERLPRPFSAELRALFPYLDDFCEAYVLRYPAGARGEKVLAAGVLGRMEFDWTQ